jgi:MFS family permease
MTASELEGRSLAGKAALGKGVATTFAALTGLTFGPSVIAVLSFGVFVRPIQAEFGWSRVQVSLAAIAVSYMIMAVSPLQGWLTDRFGARRVVLYCLPAFSAGLALFYWQPANLGVFYLLWALLPLLGIGLLPLSYLKSVSGWFDRRLGLALGVANAGIGLGSAIVPIVASALIAGVGWRAAFLVLGVLVLAVTWPINFFFLREAVPAEVVQTAPDAVEGMGFSTAVRQHSFLGLAAAFFLLGLSTTALITQQVPMLIDAGWTP